MQCLDGDTWQRKWRACLCKYAKVSACMFTVQGESCPGESFRALRILLDGFSNAVIGWASCYKAMRHLDHDDGRHAWHAWCLKGTVSAQPSKGSASAELHQHHTHATLQPGNMTTLSDIACTAGADADAHI